jgi:hypothetical protein
VFPNGSDDAAIQAWASMCPRYTAWDEALRAGLIQIERGDGMRLGQAYVSLTPHGQNTLAGTLIQQLRERKQCCWPFLLEHV